MKVLNTVVAVWICGVAAVSCFVVLQVINPYNKGQLNTITSDGSGYYLYLPAAIIYQDFQYGFARENAINKKYFGAPRAAIDKLENSRYFNRYFMGTSILILPFFLLAIPLAWLLNYPIDGYSLPFQWAVFLAALSYFLAGLELLRRVLQQAKLSQFAVFLTLISVGLATNLITYVWSSSSFSHVYAFFLVAAALFLWQKLVSRASNRLLFYFLTVVALILITRPTTVISLCGLFSLGYPKGLLQAVSRFRKALWGGLGLALFFVFLQLYLFKIQQEYWGIWSYKNDGFDFSNPHFLEFLWGYRKGLFVYSPIWWLALPGMVITWKKSKRAALSVLVVFLLSSFVLSSWSQWWFGGGFGSRSLIDYYPVFALPLAWFFEQLGSRGRKIILVPVGILVALNGIMNYQYRFHIIAYDKMNSDKFWQVFLQTDSVFRFATFEPEKYKDDEKVVNEFSVTCKSYNQCNSWSKTPSSHRVFDEDSCVIVDKENAFGLALKIPAHQVLTPGVKTTYSYHADFKIKDKKTPAVVVSTLLGSGNAWRSIKLNRVVRKTDEWVRGGAEFPAFKDYSESDTLVFLLFNEDQEPVWIKNLEIRFYHHQMNKD